MDAKRAAAVTAPAGREQAPVREPVPVEDAPKRLMSQARRPLSIDRRVFGWYSPIERHLRSFVRAIKAWSVVELIQLASTLFVVVTAAKWLSTRGEQREAERRAAQSAAWQVINTAQGKGGSGGRVGALEALARDTVSLSGVVLTNAYLAGVELPHAHLEASRLDSADLSLATLDGAHLNGATLTAANLVRASLVSANLYGATLVRASLFGARLDGAYARGATLTGADLRRATFAGTNLIGANLTAANLTGASLAGAVLDSAVLTNATLDSLLDWHQIGSLHRTNLFGARRLPPGFRCWALDTMGAVEMEIVRGMARAPEPARPYCR